MKISQLASLLITVFLVSRSSAGSVHGIERLKCINKDVMQKYQEEHEETVLEKRVNALRHEIRSRTSSHGAEVEAFIVTSFDEHQNYQPDDSEGRLQFISGFSGPIGDAVITLNSAAFWTESKYLELAERELDCSWKLFVMGDDPTIASWLAKQIASDKFVGADPRTTPHQLWLEWERDLNREFLKLTKVRNLIDSIWGDEGRHVRDFSIKSLNSSYTGVSWRNKTDTLKDHLRHHRCDAMVVTSLTEIAYLLNLRGGDFRYLPVFRAYLVVSHWETVLYTNRSNMPLEVQSMLKFDFKTNSCYEENCVIIKHYHDVWKDLRTLSHRWKRVLVPTMNAFDMGASEAIYSALNREIILEHSSPIIFMRAQKNEVEREGMRRAHIRDAVAMIDTLSYLEERYISGDTLTEAKMVIETDRSRHEQKGNQGLSFRTVVAFGPNAAKQFGTYYPPQNFSLELTNKNLILFDSGGQYLDGTTSIARTVHLGQPTAEMKQAYTNVLAGLIRLSMLVFPDNLKPAEIDTLIRGPLWGARQDYSHLSGNGIGSFLSVEESPIDIAYTMKHKYVFKDGYFFTVAPGYYKKHQFGIRLKNVLEVVDTEDKHINGGNFLAFRVTTLVPFETKLIDKNLLSLHEKKWLNDYNARIREIVGDELKRQYKMPAFYWLMNQTEHIREFITESEYRKNSSHQLGINFMLIILIVSSQLIVSRRFQRS